MTLILSRSDVETILERCGAEVLEDLVGKIADGYREMATGSVLQHPRIYLRVAEEGERRPLGLFSMSALLPGAGRMGSRLLALGGTGGDGILVLFDHQEKRLLSILDDSTLHNYRTGAPAALATRYLATENVRSVGVIGSSGIAQGTLAMVCHVRPSVEVVKVYSPTESHRERFATEMAARLKRNVRAATSAQEAASDADVIITATDADRPVVADDCIKTGAHVNVMARNEVEMATFRRSKTVVGSVLAQRELDPPWRDPIPEEWLHGELTDLVSGRVPGRTSPTETTVFVGSGPLAMWDVAAASAFYEAGRRLGVGTDVQLR